MTKWTEANTEGFSADELSTLNEAQTRLEAAWNAQEDHDLQAAISDKLNNAWNPGMTADDLVAAVSA